MSWGNTEVSLVVRCGSLVGVGDHIRVRIGRHGNTGEPTVSTRREAEQGPPLDQRTGLPREHAAPGVTRRKAAGDSGIITEGNRREREGRRQS
ncbi:MAG: hypothetical protein R6W31_15285 [Bacteroidales bacterium]